MEIKNEGTSYKVGQSVVHTRLVSLVDTFSNTDTNIADQWTKDRVKDFEQFMKVMETVNKLSDYNKDELIWFLEEVSNQSWLLDKMIHSHIQQTTIEPESIPEETDGMLHMPEIHVSCVVAEKPSLDWTKARLLDYCTEHNIEVNAKMTKEGILGRIEEAK